MHGASRVPPRSSSGSSSISSCNTGGFGLNSSIHGVPGAVCVIFAVLLLLFFAAAYQHWPPKAVSLATLLQPPLPQEEQHQHQPPSEKRDPCILHRGSVASHSGLVLVPAMWVHSYPASAWHTEFDTCAYQRHDPSAPAYVPNLSYEAGIYLRYIVDHYDRLPELIVFIQEDAGPDELDRIRCLQRSNASSWGWSPVTLHDYWQRGPEIWKNICEEDVHSCWVGLASDFGIALPTAALPRVGMYGRSNFAVTGARLRETPLAAFRAAYRRLVLSPHCLQEEVWNGKPIVKRCSDKDNGGCTFEHLQHALLGRQPLMMPKFTQTEWCQRYGPSSSCHNSPCTINPPL